MIYRSILISTALFILAHLFSAQEHSASRDLVAEGSMASESTAMIQNHFYMGYHYLIKY